MGLSDDNSSRADLDERPTKNERIGHRPSLASRTVTDGPASLDDSELLQLVLGERTRADNLLL